MRIRWQVDLQWFIPNICKKSAIFLRPANSASLSNVRACSATNQIVVSNVKSSDQHRAKPYRII